MSYCAILIFRDGELKEQIEYRNAWRGAARIWDALFDRYLKNPAVEYDSWIHTKNQQALWDLALDDRLTEFERAVHVSTFDRFYVSRENFPRFCEDLRKFVEKYPTGYECHLKTWADAIEKIDCDAISFYVTSVSENPWHKYDEEKDIYNFIPLSDGFEVYDWMAKN